MGESDIDKSGFGRAVFKGEGAPTGVPASEPEAPFVIDTPRKKLAMAMWEVMGGHLSGHWRPEDFLLYVDRLVERGLAIPEDVTLHGRQQDSGV